MEITKLDYTSRYHYKVNNVFVVKTSIKVPEKVVSRFIVLDTDGTLYINQDYAWDGASGAADTGLMRASLAHDALYQLIREKRIPLKHRKAADKLLVEIAAYDGVGYFRCKWIYAAVRLFGKKAATSHKPNDVIGYGEDLEYEVSPGMFGGYC